MLESVVSFIVHLRLDLSDFKTRSALKCPDVCGLKEGRMFILLQLKWCMSQHSQPLFNTKLTPQQIKQAKQNFNIRQILICCSRKKCESFKVSLCYMICVTVWAYIPFSFAYQLNHNLDLSLLSCFSIKHQILGLMVVRKLLDMVFSQHDLAWLDDLLPEKEKKKSDDDKKKGKEKEKDKKKPKADDSEEEVRFLSLCCPLQNWCFITSVSGLCP